MRTIAGYAIGAELGRGGMGRVLRVKHLATGIERALKVMEGVSGPEAIARFEREAEALAKASGAGAVAIHETGLERGAFWYVMDLMAGGSLRDRLKAAGRMPWREACAVMARVARMVDRCHAIGLVHRDLKPENVLFDDSGSPRLADFGCVRDAGQRSLTEAGEVLGTLSYMSPEQLQGQRVDGRTDVFALGVILHELVAGERPFAGGSWSELLIAIGEATRRPLEESAGAPAELDAIVRRATAAAAADRFPRSLELAVALERVAKEDYVPERKPPWALLLATVCLAATFAAGAAWYAGHEGRRPVVDPGVLASAVATTSSSESLFAIDSRLDAIPRRPTLAPANRARAEAALAELGSRLNIEYLTDQSGLERASREARKALIAVGDVDPVELRSIVAPCTSALRMTALVGVKDQSATAVLRRVTLFALEPLLRPERRDPMLRLGCALLERADEVTDVNGSVADVIALSETVERDDPIFAAVARWAAVDRVWLHRGRGGRFAAAKRALEIDDPADALIARASPEERRSAAIAHERHRFEFLRDIHHALHDEPSAPDRERHKARALDFAVRAVQAVGGTAGGTLGQTLRVFLSLAPTDARIREVIAGNPALRSHPLYFEWLRLNEGVEPAIKAVEKALAKRRDPQDRRDLIGVYVLALAERDGEGDRERALATLEEAQKIDVQLNYGGSLARFYTQNLTEAVGRMKKN